MVAWHNDPELKAHALARAQEHRLADRYMQEEYLQRTDAGEWRGCFHGCLSAERLAAESGCSVTDFMTQRRMGANYWHEQADRLWGIPSDVAGKLDDLFETIDIKEAPLFAVAAIEAIPVGADLSGVIQQFEIWEESEMEGDVWPLVEEDAEKFLQLLREAPIP